MAASEDPTKRILACLQAAAAPLSAREVRDRTGIPLPLVTRVLQTAANESFPEVERIDTGDRVVYEYIGLGLEPADNPPAAGSVAQPQTTPAEHDRAPRATQGGRPYPPAGETAPLRQSTRSPPVDPAEALASSRAVYRALAEKLTVPMNLTRLIRETGHSAAVLKPALEVLVAAGHVTAREMLEDVVYRAVSDLTALVDELPPLRPAASPVVHAAPAAAIDPEWLMELQARLDEQTGVAEAVLAEAEAALERVRSLVEELEFWRNSTAELIRRLGQSTDSG